jgi:hypothetical protein
MPQKAAYQPWSEPDGFNDIDSLPFSVFTLD